MFLVVVSPRVGVGIKEISLQHSLTHPLLLPGRFTPARVSRRSPCPTVRDREGRLVGGSVFPLNVHLQHAQQNIAPTKETPRRKVGVCGGRMSSACRCREKSWILHTSVSGSDHTLFRDIYIIMFSVCTVEFGFLVPLPSVDACSARVILLLSQSPASHRNV